jgi:hypothetical protein
VRGFWKVCTLELLFRKEGNQTLTQRLVAGLQRVSKAPYLESHLLLLIVILIVPCIPCLFSVIVAFHYVPAAGEREFGRGTRHLHSVVLVAALNRVRGAHVFLSVICTFMLLYMYCFDMFQQQGNRHWHSTWWRDSRG